jgi:hypothetical protein
MLTVATMTSDVVALRGFHNRGEAFPQESQLVGNDYRAGLFQLCDGSVRRPICDLEEVLSQIAHKSSRKD